MEPAALNILDLLPQAPPFVMVDKLLYNDDTISKSTFTIAPDNCMVTGGHFTAGGLMENIAQTAAARVGYIAHEANQPVQGGYIGAVKDLEILFLPPVGSSIETEIEIQNQVFNVSVITGSVRCNDQLAARCEMKVFLNADE